MTDVRGLKMRTATPCLVLTVLAAAIGVAPAAAQSLDALPTVVADMVRDAERQCRAEGGEPVYEAAYMVRKYFMGPVAAGRETYVLTFDEFECAAIEASGPDVKEPVDVNPLDPPEPDRASIFCDEGRCRIAVFLPSERDRWVKAFDGEVVTWAPQQRDGNVHGPNVRLRIVTMAPQCKKPAPETCNSVFRAAGTRLVEDQ
jgi:hypothetical protein